MNIREQRTIDIYHYKHFCETGNKERARLKLKEESVEIFSLKRKILLLGVLILTIIECCLDVDCKKSMDLRDKQLTT